jgi:hypothetical protein
MEKFHPKVVCTQTFPGRVTIADRIGTMVNLPRDGMTLLH